MLDPRFCGATGQGGFGAVASECVNEVAAQILRERRLEERIRKVLEAREKGLI